MITAFEFDLRVALRLAERSRAAMYERTVETIGGAASVFAAESE